MAKNEFTDDTEFNFRVASITNALNHAKHVLNYADYEDLLETIQDIIRNQGVR